MRILLYLTTYFLLYSCTSLENFYDAAIKNVGEQNLLEFKDIGVSIRGTDNKGGTIYVIGKLGKGLCDHPIFINIDNTTNKVKEVNMEILHHSCEINEAHYIDLIFKFKELNVQGLRVDSLGNIYLNIEDPERPSIAKFTANNPSIDPYYKWELIRDNWYKRVK